MPSATFGLTPRIQTLRLAATRPSRRSTSLPESVRIGRRLRLFSRLFGASPPCVSAASGVFAFDRLEKSLVVFFENFDYIFENEH
ncbi:MAG: hypothetical protein ACRYGL_06330 [Janthinobacterium lividum]